MTLKFVYRKNVGAEWRKSFEAKVTTIAKSATGAARESAVEIEREGRLDISRAGNFGRRWQEGLSARAFPTTGFLINARIEVVHTVLGARVHEFGGLILGRPLLWLPLTFSDAKGSTAKEFAAKNGGLFQVTRKNGKRPLLFSLRDHQPKFVGVEKVRVPARWHIRKISLEVMNVKFVGFYNRQLAINI